MATTSSSNRPPGRRYTQELRFALSKHLKARSNVARNGRNSADAGGGGGGRGGGSTNLRKLGGSMMDVRLASPSPANESDAEVETDPLDELCDSLLRATKYSLDMIVTQPHVLPEYPGAYLVLSKFHPGLPGGETVIFAGTAPDGLRYTLSHELVAFPRRVDGVLARWRLNESLRDRLKVQFMAGPYITHGQVVDHVTSQLGYCPEFNRGSSYTLEESPKPWVTIETMRRQAQPALSSSLSSSSSSSSSGSSRSSVSSSSSPSPISSPSPTRNYFPSANQESTAFTRAIPHRVPPYEAARACGLLVNSAASSVDDIQGSIPATPGIYSLIDAESNKVMFTGSCPSLLRSLQRHIWPTGLAKVLVDLQRSGKLDCISARVIGSPLPRRGLTNKELVTRLRSSFRCAPFVAE